MQTLFLLLLIIPFFYRYLFWSYVFQLKEYRADRLKDYLCSPQWRKALFSKLFFIEIFILFYTFLNLFADFYFDYFIYFILAYISVLNLFYLVKILFKKVFFPKNTLRQKLSYFISWIFVIWYFFIIYNFDLFYFIYFNISVLILVFFPQILIFLSNFIILPLVNYQKQKLINKAKIKSENNEKTIKIWVTWSYWKSSVKEYLAFLLWESWKTLSTKENINTEMWVTSVILDKLNESYDYFVAEMWAYKVGEIKLLWEIVNHKYWFLTAVWNQHICLFWSLENIKKWKSEIALKVLENNWILYVNWDNENIRSIKFPKWLKIVTYWVFKENDAISKIVWYDGEFMEFKFLYKHESFFMKTNLLWDHNIVNITWVLAFLFDIWVDIESIKDKLLKLPKPKHTLKVSKKKGFTIIDDTYNLSVEWLFSWINVLKYFDGEKVLIVDDILELWKMASEVHYDIWKSIWIMKKVDKVFFVWENYEEYFVSWLIDAWFSEENIIKDLKNISKNSVLLFEWRKARNYIDFWKNIL
jgi:UDP-N-acetylmuramoyl-tripeptide--D-alanyl-D-alanine ligase